MADMNDGKRCLICNEAFEQSPIIGWESCGHVCCVYCSVELMIAGNIECPAHKNMCENFIVQTKHGKSGSLSVCEFQKYLVDTGDIINMIMEDNWWKCLDYYSKYFKEIHQIKTMCINVMEKNRNQGSVKEIFDRFHELYNNNLVSPSFLLRNQMIGNILSRIQTPSERHRDLETNVKLISSLGSMVSNLSVRQFIHTWCIDRQSAHDRDSLPLKQMKWESSDRGIISRYFRGLIISKVTKNKQLYERYHSNQELNFKDICLICLSFTSISYGSFQDCDHKICLNCIKDYSIIEASCPLDSQVAKHLIIRTSSLPIKGEDETSSEYLSNNMEVFSLVKNANLRDSVRAMMSEILKKKDKILPLIRLANRVERARNFEKSRYYFDKLRVLVIEIRGNIDTRLYTGLKLALNLMGVDEHGDIILVDRDLEMARRIEVFLDIFKSIHSARCGPFFDCTDTTHDISGICDSLETAIKDLLVYHKKIYKPFTKPGKRTKSPRFWKLSKMMNRLNFGCL